MKRLSCAIFRTASALVGSGLLLGSVALAQSSSSLSGRAFAPTGEPIANPVVRLISDTTLQPTAHPLRYTLIGDRLGKFSQEGIAPGAYLVMLFTDGRPTNILERIWLKPGDASVLAFSTGAQPQVQVEAATGALSMADRQSISARTR